MAHGALNQVILMCLNLLALVGLYNILQYIIYIYIYIYNHIIIIYCIYDIYRCRNVDDLISLVSMGSGQ